MHTVSNRRALRPSLVGQTLLLALALIAPVGSAFAQQSVRLVSVDGIAVPPDQVYAPGPQIDLQWEVVDECGYGVDELDVWVDGRYYSSFFIEGGFGGVVSVNPQFFQTQDCQHTIALIAYMPVPPDCSGSQPQAESEPQVIWTTPMVDCVGGGECDDATTVGNPVDVATGKMHHEMTDIVVRGPLPIEFERYYDTTTTDGGPLGYGWRHSYSMRLEDAGFGRKVVHWNDGRRIWFTRLPDSGTWDENRLEHMTLTQPTAMSWRVTDQQHTLYDFDASGRLTGISDRNDNRIVLEYTGSNLTAIGQDVDLDGLSDRSIALAYDGSGRLLSAIAGSAQVTYTRTGDDLTRVDYADDSFVTYAYDDANHPHHMTAARDALGRAIEEHTYYTGGPYDGRVHTTQSEGGNDAYTLAYDTPVAGETTVTNALGEETVHEVDSFTGLVTSSTGPGCSSCGTGEVETGVVRDRWLNVIGRVDGDGVETTMTYDARGNLLTRTDAVETPRERTRTFTYDPVWNVPTSMSIPTVGTCGAADRVQTSVYHATNGNLLEQTLTGCDGNDPLTQTTLFGYDGHGQLATVNGPRTDVTDVSIYEYYADDDPDPFLRTRLFRSTNAAGHETIYSDYDVRGNLGAMTDPNGVVTTYTYDSRDRVTETRIKRDGEVDIVTTRSYDSVGDLRNEASAECYQAGGLSCPYSTEYTYDGVHRLTRIGDAFGNEIVYTYDLAGNRIREERRDASAGVRQFTNYAYDALNRLEYVYYTATSPEDPGSVYAKYTYNDNGTRAGVRDPEGHVTTFTYDELQRLTGVLQSTGGGAVETFLDYDVQGNLVSMTDPLGNVTTYGYSDAGWRLTTASPDAGTTTVEYDVAGNPVTSLLPTGVTVTRTYDALNRPTAVLYPGGAQNLNFEYDSPSVTFGIGRRTGMTDPSGTTVYAYDERGQLTAESKTIGPTTYTTSYAYDRNGNLTSLGYPGPDPGLRQGEAIFSYDLADRATQVAARVDGASTLVAAGTDFEPFGPRKTLSFGNGLTDSRTHGTRYQTIDWTVGGLLSHTNVFDLDLNLTARTDHLVPANNRSYGYDELHRLVHAGGPWGGGGACAGGATYTYDANGNRLCNGEDSPETTYGHAPGTNRLSVSVGLEIAAYTYDANGNVTSDAVHTYEYDEATRLATVDSGTNASYTYDGDGRRASKRTEVTTHFFYDPQGRLLTEIVPELGTGSDYVYLDGAPVARVDWIVAEALLDDSLRVDAAAPAVSLDWSLYPDGGHRYVVRRKLLTDPGFDGNEVIADVDDPVQQYDDPVLGDGNSYLYRVFRRAAFDTLYLVHSDHLGTPLLISDASGNAAWRGELRPFGEVFSQAPISTENRLRFPGQYFDAETGLYDNWHRTYDPRLGRYRQVDPIGVDRSGTNPYLYALARPTVLTDPTGLESPTLADFTTCFLNPIDCPRAYPCRKKATDAALAVFGRRGGLNDRKDAFRHCYLNCCMAKKIGASEAKKFGDSHEAYPKNPMCEREMDLWNNRQGRKVGPGTDCTVHCLRAPLQNALRGSCGDCRKREYYPGYYDDYGNYLPPP